MHPVARSWPVQILLVATCPLLLHGASMAENADPPARPPAAAIDAGLLQEAMAEAVANGIATLLARQQAEANETDLVFPPAAYRRRIGWEPVGERRYSRQMVTVPVYERRYEERLVPQRDQYGSITGYRRERVEVARRQIGQRQVERILPDPEGDIVRVIRQPIYEPDGEIVYARGFHGLNAMALYVLCKAGLGEEVYTRRLAEALAWIISQHGMPDHTWDLAWLAAAFANYGGEEGPKLTERLVGKLIDGQIRQSGAASGLWGPIVIHPLLFMQLVDADRRLIGQLRQLERQVEALPAHAHRDRALGDAQIKRLDDLRQEVANALQECTTHGMRLRGVTQAQRVEERHFAGWSYYGFNQVAADVDSTAVVAFALDEARARGRLPRESHRMQVGGQVPVRPENTVQTVTQALMGLTRIQLPGGGWAEHNALEPHAAFSPGLGSVFEPLRAPLPQLVSWESIESNVRGGSAMSQLLRTAPQMLVRYRQQTARGEQRAQAAMDQLLDEPLYQAQWAATHARVTPTEDLRTRAGAVQVPPPGARGEDEAMPYTAWSLPYRVLEGSIGLFRPIDPTQEGLRNEALYRQLAYRLLVTQAQDGQWVAAESRAIGLSSSETALLLHARAVDIAARHQRNAERNAHFDHREELRQATQGRYHTAQDELYGTLAALAVLVEGLQKPVSLADVTILPPEMDELAGGDDSEREPLTPNQAARALPRPNHHLSPLLDHVRRAQASDDETAATAGP